MNLIDFSKKIETVYAVIDSRQSGKKIEYINAGFEVSRISFEDIDLEDIFSEELVPLLDLILKYFKSSAVCLIKNKIYKIYIATLCEIAKKGFNQGGILKTMDTYIGFSFNRNRHYELIKEALHHENIVILSKRNSHYYEETIIYEAGIPKKFHRDVLSLFQLYWKWMKGIEKLERMQFLKDFINEEPIYETYILVSNDYERMKSYREVTSDFKEKTLKVCYKFEEVFCAIDEYPEFINETNIATVCSQISENLRYNIETVIRTSEIRKIFLNYSQRISFSKLQKIINNLSVEISIIIPTGITLTKERYNSRNFYGGLHNINGIVYEVSYAIGLTLEEIFSFPRQTVERQNQNYIYISDEYFEVEIDGIAQNVKTFIFRKESLYVYVGKVPSASVAYIDNICIQSDESYKISASVRKIWNRELRKNLLAVHVKEARCCNVDYSMKSVSVSNGFDSIIRQTNRNGFSIIRDKWLDIPDFTDLKDISIVYSVANVPLMEIIVQLESIMLFSFLSGIQIRKTYDVSQFYGDNRLIIYSIVPLETPGKELVNLGYYQGLNVYYTEMDLSKDTYIIGELSIIIKKHSHTYMSFASKYGYRDEKICFEEDSDVHIQLHNADLTGIYYLKLSHDSVVKTIHLSAFDNLECMDIKDFMYDYTYLDGKWTLTLFNEQENVFELNYTVLPKLLAKVAEYMYCEGEKVSVEIFASSNCFFIDNNFSASIQVDVGIAQIEMEGNLVKSKELTYEVYNTRSECFQEMIIKPAVWGIRLLDYEKNIWHLTKDVFLTYKALDKYGVFVCSSKSHYLNIKCNNQVIRREIFAGYNRVGIRGMFSDWKEANLICFFDEPNRKQVITIAFEPSMQYINTSFENAMMVSTLCYEGAINTDIMIRAYAKGELIKSVSRMAEKTKFLIHFVLPEIYCYNKEELTFEVSFDKRDPFTLHKVLVELVDSSAGLILSEYCNFYKLIERHISSVNKSKCISMKNLTVLQLIGGN
jgi:hypothetical protein